MTETLTGGCFCGAVRFELDLPSRFCTHCHCENCRRAHGAAFVTWVTFPVDSFSVTKGALIERQSSPGVTRGHCAECGTTMTYTNDRWPDDIDVTATCLDHPGTIKPDSHIWIEDKQPWIEIGDGLPQYEQRRTAD